MWRETLLAYSLKLPACCNRKNAKKHSQCFFIISKNLWTKSIHDLPLSKIEHVSPNVRECIWKRVSIGDCKEPLNHFYTEISKASGKRWWTIPFNTRIFWVIHILQAQTFCSQSSCLTNASNRVIPALWFWNKIDPSTVSILEQWFSLRRIPHYYFIETCMQYILPDQKWSEEMSY